MLPRLNSVSRAALRLAPRQLAGPALSVLPRSSGPLLLRIAHGPRAFSTSRPVLEASELDEIERAEDYADVVIVGAGPAGLSAAIRLKQLANEEGKELRVVVLEKGPEVGSHILSGAVIEPRALNEFLPNWKEDGAPLLTPATHDSMYYLTKKSAYPIPHPPQMSNHGNYIVSLSKFVRWLGEQAEALDIEVYPGFAGASLKFSEDGSTVVGVTTNDIGLDKNFEPKESFEPGMTFYARSVLLAEGCHGSLSKKAIAKYDLRDGKDPQTYGIGIKEVWKVKPENHKPGHIQHTIGWPVDSSTYGGSFLYHLEDGLVAVGLVIGLDYKNPYISPYKEFQRLKHHPAFASTLEGGECIQYGARALNEGGYQSIPKLTFPGGALIGCSAGFLNVPKIKGTHTAMKSGLLAAEAVFNQFKEIPEEELLAENEEGMPVHKALDLSEYESLFENSWAAEELKQVRNVRPSFNTPLGLWGGVAYSGLDTLFLKGRVPWTFHYTEDDYAETETADHFEPIEYPAPDGKLSFDLLTSVSLSGTNHAENQPVHLHIEKKDVPHHIDVNTKQFAGLLQKVCPAGVYEYIEDEDTHEQRLVINSQNCVHCKTCSIKCPTQDIEWRVPEGSGGPKYSLT